jgi:hypothetical protein
MVGRALHYYENANEHRLVGSAGMASWPAPLGILARTTLADRAELVPETPVYTINLQVERPVVVTWANSGASTRRVCSPGQMTLVTPGQSQRFILEATQPFLTLTLLADPNWVREFAERESIGVKLRRGELAPALAERRDRLRLLSPGASKPATHGRFKTSHGSRGSRSRFDCTPACSRPPGSLRRVA